MGSGLNLSFSGRKKGGTISIWEVCARFSDLVDGGRHTGHIWSGESRYQGQTSNHGGAQSPGTGNQVSPGSSVSFLFVWGSLSLAVLDLFY